MSDDQSAETRPTLRRREVLAGAATLVAVGGPATASIVVSEGYGDGGYGQGAYGGATDDGYGGPASDDGYGEGGFGGGEFGS
ncbi:hypothetical protein [Halapricum desulfuricans]|uniref:Uncharacterized protein n=1 Tax=Halapricum desulfuricans TaxID=2841257 RepID=A0A897N765_9EURY|nr:hypothetical protein [Halapricum desulfuricans]QSG07033.1 hypothetical protein HSR121_2713 [Halapricum desulfuricans]